jgi:hypothetical protein
MFAVLFVSIFFFANIAQANAYCLFNCYEPTTYDYVKSFFFNLFNGLFQLTMEIFKWILYKKFLEATIAILVIAIVLLIRRGRHRQQETTIVSTNNSAANTSTTAATTSVNLINTVHCRNEQPNKPNNTGFSDKNVNQIRIPLLTENYNFQNWIAILEYNLRGRDKSEWVGTFLNNQEGFDHLKQ